jgi:hypothetical protein
MSTANEGTNAFLSAIDTSDVSAVRGRALVAAISFARFLAVVGPKVGI